MNRIATLSIVIAIVAILLVVAYLEGGFKFVLSRGSTTTVTTTTASTTTTNTTSTTATTSVNIGPLYICNQLALAFSKPNNTTVSRCELTTNSLGVWVGAGNAGTVHLLMTGANGQTYINQTISYDCLTFYENLTAPQQVYNLTVTTGPGGGECGYTIIKGNDTTKPPNQVYDFFYNGNFSNGQYTGWNQSGAGFGTAPLNFTYANNAVNRCYYGSPWVNTPGTFAASTFHCGLQASAGNLTSSEFIVNKPFLNFKIVSVARGDIYIEVLYNNQTAVKAAYNTYNVSLPGNSSSVFRNASIPLTNVAGKAVTVRIVSGATGLPSHKDFILAGGFTLSDTPDQQYNWIVTNLTTYNVT